MRHAQAMMPDRCPICKMPIEMGRYGMIWHPSSVCQENLIRRVEKLEVLLRKARTAICYLRRRYMPDLDDDEEGIRHVRP